MEIRGKIAFITGSTRGIGKAIAEAFANAGAIIVLNGRGEVSSELVEEIEALGTSCYAVSGDISNYDDAVRMFSEIEKKIGIVDILVNNAGITNDKLLLRMSADDFSKCIDVNLTGTFNMTQVALKKMYKKRAGAIINVSSVSGLIGNVGQANYAASKAGVIGFTKSVAREAAARGITCNAIAPGFIDTEMTEVLPADLKASLTQQIPLKCFGEVAHVADAAVFLAENPYITGQVLNIDGGLVMNG